MPNGAVNLGFAAIRSQCILLVIEIGLCVTRIPIPRRKKAARAVLELIPSKK